MTPLDICLVTCDIVGPVRNGGIGTAYDNLAHALARAGHRVTILYAGGSHCEQGTIQQWVREFHTRGIALVPMPALEPTDAIQGSFAGAKVAYDAYRWIKDRRFDIVHCHEWRGVGFYIALAKHQGLCLRNAVLCVGAHSPSLWHREGMNELATAEDLETDFMERESVALADVLWSPSAYLVTWLRREGWRLPRKIVVRPNVLLDAAPVARHPGRVVPAPAARETTELVFFGRLETRKGLDLFCDAIDALLRRGVVPPRVTFLGKVATVQGAPSAAYVRRRAQAWPCAWDMLIDLDRDRALAYLAGPGRVAVLPSRIDNSPYTVLECLGARIPFLAAATGGIPELVRAADRSRCLFALSALALADRLSDVLRLGLAPALPHAAPHRVERAWLTWHETAGRSGPQREAKSQKSDVTSHTSEVNPLVSVCITHRNRPEFLRAALGSIEAQDYAPIEVVLVDDGSDREDVHAALDEIQQEFTARKWTLIRQPNRYLGAARNAAVHAARGEFILFMDDDNLAKPHEVSTLVAAARASGADILTCFLSVFQSRAADLDAPPIGVWSFLGGALAPGLLRNVFGDANALVRRRVFDALGGFTEDFGVGCEDWEFFARAVLHGFRLEVVPEPLVFYRQSAAGMLGMTSLHANRMRALRPYLALLPAHLRPLVHLAKRTPQRADVESGARLDHVQRAVVFGTGDAGRRALDLAHRCGWDVPWLVDNNKAMWDVTAHGLPVRHPDSLTAGGFDVVIIASLAGQTSISTQLTHMGLEPGRQFVHFLDPVRVGGVTVQLDDPSAR